MLIFVKTIKNMRRVIFLFLFFLTSCDRTPRDVQLALKNSTENRVELQKVIEHFKLQKDENKLKAAYFIIANMPSHYSLDTSGYESFLQVLSLLDSIRLKNSDEDSIKFKVNRAWNEVSSRLVYSNPILYDLQHIKADSLINHIDRKFIAWRSNPYTKNLSFKLFCRHILPYRPKDKILPDDYFIYNNASNLEIVKKLYPKNILEMADSILIKYNDIIYSAEILKNFPYLITSSAIQSKRIECEDRVWFNYYLLSSAGIPVAIDFIPNWGNRNAAHTWNTIVMDDDSYPFEPFYSTDRWEYKNIYNNKMEDGFVKWWGKFRLPKVYRVTFDKVENDIIKDDRVSIEDIPALFRSDRVVDVSQEYFETSDIKLTLERSKPENTYYAYLCVQNRKEWIPVQYGKIKGNTVAFREMGKDIVYLPIYYKDGIGIPAGEPFYLNKDGKVESIRTEGSIQDINIYRRYPINEKKALSNSLLEGSYFSLANKENFSDAVIAAKVNFTPEMKKFLLNNTHERKFRYVKFTFSAKAYLSEISVETSDNESNKNKIILNNTVIDEQLAKQKDTLIKEIVIDLGTERRISSFGFCGLNDIFAIMPDMEYELFYWKDEWISLGKTKSNNSELIYRKVPSGVLYYLDCSERDAFKRMFTFKDGRQLFW